MAGEKTKRSRWLLIALAIAHAAVAAAGLYRVRPGEVALRRAGDGSVAGVAGEGWHWRLPLAGSVHRYPTEPIELERDLEIETGAGTRWVVAVSGRFGLGPDGARAWVDTAGWEPFVDALWKRLGTRLGDRLGDASAPGEVFRASFAESLRQFAAGELEAMGARVESLAVTLPPELNGPAVARLRDEVVRHAAPTGTKVLIVGWDGADWLMIRPLLRAGRLPHLAGLIERGVSGELRSQMPLLSPLVWTTIATGRPVLDHGIADFLVQDPDSGALVPISSASRKVHALWTLLEPFGLTVDVVGWWATWPAEAVRGTMVSDRVAYQLFDIEDGSNEGKVHPPELWSDVQARLVSAEEIGHDELSRFVDVSPEEVDRLWNSLPPERRQENKVNHLRKILATTMSYHAIILSLLEDQADLTLAYYEGTDTTGHLFARYLPPRMAGVTEEEVRRFGAAMPEFYAYADELLGELLAAVDDDTVVLVISDHGFFTGSARPSSDPSDFAAGAPQWHRLHGIVVAAGPGIRPGTVEGATILDVAPTVLALLGLPASSEMPGNVLETLLPSGRPAPPPRLASYEILPRASATRVARSAEIDRERLRELAALGYVSSSTLDESDKPSGTPGAAAGAPATGGEDLQAVATEAYNRGRILQRQGDHDGAYGQYRTAIQRMPGFGPAYASLAQLEALRGRHCQAFDILVQGLARSGNLPLAADTGLVDEAAECGKLEAAEEALAGLHATYKATSAYFAARGLLFHKMNRDDAALAEFRRALEVDPLDQLANEQMVTVLRRQGREREAQEFLAGAFEKAAGQVTAMNQLAVVALRQGWPQQAEDLLRRVLESDPGNPGVLANLAASLMQQRKVDEALAAMRQAVEREPENARNHFNLGAMLAEQGRFSEALAAFDAAAENGLRNARVYVAAAKMRFRLGDRAGTERDLRKALEIEPGDPEATQLLRVLEQG